MATVQGNGQYFEFSGNRVLFKDAAGREMIAPEETSSTVSRAYAVGEPFIYNNLLYRATAAIAQGGTITPGTNCEMVPGGIGGEVGELKSAIEILDNNALVRTETEKAEFHNVVPSEVSFYPDDRLSSVTAKYAQSENLMIGGYVSGTEQGITKTISGNMLNLTNTGSGRLTIAQKKDADTLSKIRGKTFHAYLYIKKSTSWEVGSYCTFYDGNGVRGRKYYNANTSSLIGWTDIGEITFAVNATELSYYFNDLNGAVFASGDCVWVGLYETALTDTNETVTGDDPYTITIDGLNSIDTATHESTAKYIVSTKKYVDDHTPDIIGYWNDKLYALPEKFGAVGDGTTDDSSAIADCISYAITNGKPVRGYRQYKISSPIALTGRGMDVYFHEIIYSGNGYAVEISEQEIKFSFDNIQATSGGGITFKRVSGHSCARNVVEGTLINCYNVCVYIDPTVLYCSVSVRQLSTSNGNCIEFGAPNETYTYPANEFVFRDCSCHCPNGWVLYRPENSKFYNFTVEGDCKNGIYHPNAAVCYGWRHAEFVSRYSSRISDEQSDYNNGPLILFNGDLGTGAAYNSILYESIDTIFPFSVDTDSIIKNPVFSTTDQWWAYGNNKTIIKCSITLPYSVFTAKSTSIMAKELRIVGGNKVFIPLFDTVVDITDSTYDLRYFDTCDIPTIRSATKNRFATYFNAQADTTIYLSASYCATAINEFCVDTDGHDVVIYDWMENKIFDSHDHEGTKFRMKCIANYSDRGLGLADSNNRYWTYDGTNHIWKIEVLE